MANQFQPVRSDQAAFNIKEYFFKYLRFLPLFIFFIVFAQAIAWMYLRYTPQEYRSRSQLILKEEKKGGGGSNDKFQELFVDSRSKNILNEIEYIKSRPLMKRVV